MKTYMSTLLAAVLAAALAQPAAACGPWLIQRTIWVQVENHSGKPCHVHVAGRCYGVLQRGTVLWVPAAEGNVQFFIAVDGWQRVETVHSHQAFRFLIGRASQPIPVENRPRAKPEGKPAKSGSDEPSKSEDADKLPETVVPQRRKPAYSRHKGLLLIRFEAP